MFHKSYHPVEVVIIILASLVVLSMLIGATINMRAESRHESGFIASGILRHGAGE